MSVNKLDFDNIMVCLNVIQNNLNSNEDNFEGLNEVVNALYEKVQGKEIAPLSNERTLEILKKISQITDNLEQFGGGGTLTKSLQTFRKVLIKNGAENLRENAKLFKEFKGLVQDLKNEFPEEDFSNYSGVIEKAEALKSFLSQSGSKLNFENCSVKDLETVNILLAFINTRNKRRGFEFNGEPMKPQYQEVQEVMDLCKPLIQSNPNEPENSESNTIEKGIQTDKIREDKINKQKERIDQVVSGDESFDIVSVNEMEDRDEVLEICVVAKKHNSELFNEILNRSKFQFTPKELDFLGVKEKEEVATTSITFQQYLSSILAAVGDQVALLKAVNAPHYSVDFATCSPQTVSSLRRLLDDIIKKTKYNKNVQTQMKTLRVQFEAHATPKPHSPKQPSRFASALPSRFDQVE